MKISRLLFNIILIILGFCLTIFWTIIPASKIVTANTNIQHQTSEIRGVWLTNVDSDVLFSSANTKQAVDRLASMNFNTLYPTVWQGGYTLYPSKVAEKTFGVKRDPTPGLQKRDMLEEIIKEGHAKGLKVIPWFEFGFMAPANSELARQHPDWLTKQRNGELVKMEGIEPRVWLNPLHPEVQKFIIDLIVEIVSNYDVDGIQFDDHFGLPAEYGYDD
ncbi:MAG: glycoside hydrolase family 10 protein, partial [Microcoleaceae cyanobacterium]